MLKLNPNWVIKVRGISRPYTYLRNNGFSHNYASNLINDKIKTMKLKDIEKFCILFDCTPNDMLVWDSNDLNLKNVDTLALNTLVKANNDKEIKAILNELPFSDLEDIIEFIRLKKKPANNG